MLSKSPASRTLFLLFLIGLVGVQCVAEEGVQQTSALQTDGHPPLLVAAEAASGDHRITAPPRPPLRRLGGIRFNTAASASLRRQRKRRESKTTISSSPSSNYFPSYVARRNAYFANATREMISFVFDNYKTHAFPHSDEVTPNSCSASNNSLLGSGAFATTLIDSLDTLAMVGGMEEQFWEGVGFVCKELTSRIFGRDYRDVDGDDEDADLDGHRQGTPASADSQNDDVAKKRFTIPQQSSGGNGGFRAPFFAAPASAASSSVPIDLKLTSHSRQCNNQRTKLKNEQGDADGLSSASTSSFSSSSSSLPCGCPFSDPMHRSPQINPFVNGFEMNIRVIGGLLSAHFMIEEGIVSPIVDVKQRETHEPPTTATHVYHYDGCLLRLAVAIGRQFLPLFDTPTGIPYGSFFFKDGVREGEIQQSSVSESGTYLLEFTLLSRASGDPRFERVAKRAVRAIFKRRHPKTNLLGTHINVTSGAWTLLQSTIGSGIDSYLEYLVKQFLLTGEKEFYLMFDVLHQGIYTYLRIGSGENNDDLDAIDATSMLSPTSTSPTAGSAKKSKPSAPPPALSLLHQVLANKRFPTPLQQRPFAFYQTMPMTASRGMFGANPHSLNIERLVVKGAGGSVITNEITRNTAGLRYVKRAIGNYEHGSLCNFYPGLLALAGHTDEAKVAIRSQQSVWDAFGAFPESFDVRRGVHEGIVSNPIHPTLDFEGPKPSLTHRAATETAKFWGAVNAGAAKLVKSLVTSTARHSLSSAVALKRLVSDNKKKAAEERAASLKKLTTLSESLKTQIKDTESLLKTTQHESNERAAAGGGGGDVSGSSSAIADLHAKLNQLKAFEKTIADGITNLLAESEKEEEDEEEAEDENQEGNEKRTAQSEKAPTDFSSSTSSEEEASSNNYPLRPEHIESLYLLYEATRDDAYAEMGTRVITAIEARARCRCGYATLVDSEVMLPPQTLKARIMKDAVELKSSELGVALDQLLALTVSQQQKRPADSQAKGSNDPLSRASPLASTIVPESLLRAYFSDDHGNYHGNKNASHYESVLEFLYTLGTTSQQSTTAEDASSSPSLSSAPKHPPLPTNHKDHQESFVLSETFKYAYLLFSQLQRERLAAEWAGGLSSSSSSSSKSSTQWKSRPFLQKGTIASLNAFSTWHLEAVRECDAKRDARLRKVKRFSFASSPNSNGGSSADGESDSPLDRVTDALCASVYSRRHSLLWVFNTEGHPFPVRPEWSPSYSLTDSSARSMHWLRCCPTRAFIPSSVPTSSSSSSSSLSASQPYLSSLARSAIEEARESSESTSLAWLAKRQKATRLLAKQKRTNNLDNDDDEEEDEIAYRLYQKQRALQKKRDANERRDSALKFNEGADSLSTGDPNALTGMRRSSSPANGDRQLVPSDLSQQAVGGDQHRFTVSSSALVSYEQLYSPEPNAFYGCPAEARAGEEGVTDADAAARASADGGEGSAIRGHDCSRQTRPTEGGAAAEDSCRAIAKLSSSTQTPPRLPPSSTSSSSSPSSSVASFAAFLEQIEPLHPYTDPIMTFEVQGILTPPLHLRDFNRFGIDFKALEREELEKLKSAAAAAKTKEKKKAKEKEGAAASKVNQKTADKKETKNTSANAPSSSRKTNRDEDSSSRDPTTSMSPYELRELVLKNFEAMIASKATAGSAGDVVKTVETPPYDATLFRRQHAWFYNGENEKAEALREKENGQSRSRKSKRTVVPSSTTLVSTSSSSSSSSLSSASRTSSHSNAMGGAGEEDKDNSKATRLSVLLSPLPPLPPADNSSSDGAHGGESNVDAKLDKNLALKRAVAGHATPPAAPPALPPLPLAMDREDDTRLNCPSPHGPLHRKALMLNNEMKKREGVEEKLTNGKSDPAKKIAKGSPASSSSHPSAETSPLFSHQLDTEFSDDDSFFESRLSSEYFLLPTTRSYDE